MSIWSKIVGTIEGVFQLGLAGPKLKNNSGVVEHRNAADNAFAIARADTPVGSDDLVTKDYADTHVMAHASTHDYGGSDQLDITGTVVAITDSTSTQGVAGGFALVGHSHAHGNRSGGSLHAVATTSSHGFMSSADKTAHDALVTGFVTIPVRNQTGATLFKGRAVVNTGLDITGTNCLVDYADNATAGSRPAIGVLNANLPDVTTGVAVTQGLVVGLNTSAFVLADQLVLGATGNLIKPPPENASFPSGIIQNIGSVTKVDATDGHLLVLLEGRDAVFGDQVYALTGTSGTPSNSNKYVTNADARNNNARAPTLHASSHQNGGLDEIATATATSNAIPKAGGAGTLAIGWIPTGATSTTVCIGNDGRLSDARTPTAHASTHAAGGSDPTTPKEYGPLAADPVSPAPTGGDRYYNTTIEENMVYNSSHSKWVSAGAVTIMSGATGSTAAGSYYRGMDGMAYGNNMGHPVPKGTLVGLAICKTDGNTTPLEVLVDTTVIYTLTVTASGVTANWDVDTDFNQGAMKFRNKSAGGATASNVQITAILKRRS